MTFDEILKSQGLNDEQVTKILGEMKQNKVYTTAEQNIDTRYAKLKGDYEGVNTQLGEAQKLIEEMKKSEGKNEALQSKIADYESRIAELEAENLRTKEEAALKVALLEANAEDVDYLTFKIRERDGELKLDDEGHIKGIEDTIAALKTQYPRQFRAEAEKKVLENKLQQGENRDGITPEQFAKMGYLERTKLYNEKPDVYKRLTGKDD